MREANKGKICYELLKYGECSFNIKYKMECPYAHDYRDVRIYNYEHQNDEIIIKKTFKIHNPDEIIKPDEIRRPKELNKCTTCKNYLRN